MPNVVAALPNIGGALYSTPQSLADSQRISAVRRPKFTILSEHVEEVLVFNKFFPIV